MLVKISFVLLALTMIMFPFTLSFNISDSLGQLVEEENACPMMIGGNLSLKNDSLMKTVSRVILFSKENETLIIKEEMDYLLKFNLFIEANLSNLVIYNVIILNSDTRVLSILTDANQTQQMINQWQNDYFMKNFLTIENCSHVSQNDSVAVRAEQLGVSFVTVSIEYGVGNNNTQSLQQQQQQHYNTNVTFRVVVLRQTRLIEILFRVVVMIVVVLLTFCMGCELDVHIIWNYLKKPIAPAIGFASQYILMPLIAFGLSQALPIPNAIGFGLLTVGCSPGGGGSNLWTLLLKGDLNLSMTMTFISSIAALGMMPIWIYLLGGFYIDTSRVSIPYGQIALQLLMVVIPVVLGLVLRWKKERIGIIFSKFTRPIALLFILVLVPVAVYINWHIFRLFYYNPLIPITGALLPWFGFLLGTVLAFILRQNRGQVIAIGLETGIQNVGIAILLLMFSMPQPDGQIGASIPLAVAVFTPLPLYILFLVIKIRQKCCGKAKSDEIEVSPEDVNDNDEKEEDEQKFNDSRTPKKEKENDEPLKV